MVYRRPINGNQLVWAADWWRYTEAVVRLEALWRSWEHLRRVRQCVAATAGRASLIARGATTAADLRRRRR